MVQRSLAVAGAPTPAARLLAERVGAVMLPAPTGPHRRARPHPGLGPDLVCVVTGQGIAGVLEHLRAGNVPARLLWVSASPRSSHGDALVDEVLAAPCHPTVWDTARLGEPDLLRLAYAAHLSARGAAVVCVGDRRRARRLVRGLLARGVPARAGAD